MITLIGDKSVKKSFNIRIKPNLNFMLKPCKDIKGNNFVQEIPYIESMRKISLDLIKIQDDEPSYVRKIITYIITHLTYNTDNILLKPSDINEYNGLDKSDISKGLKRLKELKVIERACEREDLKNTKVDKNLYFVNNNMMFFGDVKKLREDWNEQYGEETGEYV